MLMLSICIPSYNRFRALQKNLNSILESNSKQFEVIIVDNCSPEDICQGVDISDSRVKIIRRNEPVYGQRNINECLSYAKGKYALLCLDKDRVNGKYLKDFISYLQKKPNICGGYCGQDFGKQIMDTKPLIYIEGAMKEFGYLSKHPSGNFYCMDYINQWFKDMTNPLLDNMFFSDILLAECAVHGEMLKFQSPMITVESPEECLKIKSISISSERGNLFFYPRNRIEQFKIFNKHLESLRCNKKNKYETLACLYKRTLLQVTIEFKHCMNNAIICTHYKVVPRIVSWREMLQWWWIFNYEFLHSGATSSSFCGKVLIILKIHVSIIIGKMTRYIVKFVKYN